MSSLRVAFKLSVLVSAVVGLALASPLPQDLAESTTSNGNIENVSILAERISDRQHEKYCRKFESLYSSQPELLWPKVKKQCIERLIYRDGNKHDEQDVGLPALPAPIAKLNLQMRKKIVGVYGTCASLVSNPCAKNDWAEVKHCIKEEGRKVKLTSGTVSKNLGSVGIALSANLMECTNRIVNHKTSK